MKFKKSLLLLLAVIMMSFSGCGYNQLQSNEEEVFKAWADLEAQLQRRADLIPNLVATVKGYATHEKGTLTDVIEARSKATQIQLTAKDLNDKNKMAQFTKAQGDLSSALNKLMVLTENYPNLKANENFTDLQHQLEGTENRITVARERYNASVQKFNYSIRKFPESLTNNILLHLERKEFFKADESAKQAPKVTF